MEVVGKIIQVLPEQGGVSKTSGKEWKLQAYVLETQEQYPRKVHFEVFGEDRIKANPYKDHCNQWEASNREPLIFYTADSPTNVDIYGNVKNEVMGFDISNFGKPSGKEIKLVTDIGLQSHQLL